MGDVNTKPLKKKVLFLLEAFNKGGIEKVTLDIVNNLNPDKYDITVQTFWWGGHCQSLVNSNIKVMPFFFKKYVKGIIRLIEYLPPRLLYTLFVRGKYDIEIAASDGGAAKVISGSTNKKAKKICWVHMDVMERGSKLKEYKNESSAKKIYEKFDSIVCVSEACKDRFIQKFGKYDVKVKRNPLPEQEIIEKANSEKIELDSNLINFVCVGRLVEQKGFDRLIKACEKLVLEGITSFNINIIGDGPLKAELEKSIKEKNLEKYINFLGYKNNPYSYIKASDVFLLSSRDEAFSLVVGESLILGVPVLATDCSGISEWLGENEEYGIILENSTNGIYSGMKYVLLEPKFLNKFKDNIPKKQKEINFEFLMNEFEELFND